MMKISKQIKKKLRKRLILSAVLYFIMQALTFISPFIMGLIIDNYIPNQNISAIIIGILIFIGIPCITVFFQMIYNYFSISFSRNIGNELSISILRNLVYKENQFFDRENSMELLAYSSKESVNYINFYITDLAKYYVTMILSFILLVIISILFNPVLGIMQLLFIPCVYFPVRKMMLSVEKQIEYIITNNAKMNQTKGDIFKAIEFIKTMRIEEHKISEVQNYNKNSVKVWGKIAVLDTLSGAWGSGFATSLFTGLTFGAGTLFCILKISHLSLTVGELVTVMAYSGLFYSYILQILNTKISKKRHEAEHEKLFSYLNLSGEREENASKRILNFSKSISFKDVNFSYNQDDLALANVNLNFNQGKWTGIIGKSGSGKSTILDIILKLYHVEDGMVDIDGEDINHINSFSIRDHITKISQDIYLFPGTIKENLLLVNELATEEEIEQAIVFACLTNYIKTLPHGINTDIGEAGKLMSGGEKQRLSIAMGILRGRKVLLLDEVTSHLDKQTEYTIVENFKKLRDLGYTIISISHELSFLRECDVIYQLEDAKVIQSGQYEDFIK